MGDVTGREFSYENVVVTKPEPSDTPPTTPGTPPTPDTPTTPPLSTDKLGDEVDESAKTHGTDGALAITGANIVWALVTGLVLILLGFVLIRRRKEQ
ncbi:LPXTG cell wall anchor domain-containing protein [Corynebacterium diphtheriae bv. mitis]|uniref:LPXTG cell wall anchor domain-containing protein n=1 Tax=Corynebacterium diphtheriae TaxID=1717 RepID=UPI0018C9DDD0|nr:LPXTG cell wall anchor domain-containing protein [Corynebacterium diphtheriae]MBG9313579.1 LPXTG cell wall anchor domain-containing protein [Corynebacterium diphtheriae bv. mitis]